MSETPQGYQGPLPAYYVQSSTPQTPTLGLTLTGVDPIVAYNFVLIDTFASSGGSGTPALPFTAVQFNNSGAFGGSAAFKWDNTNKFLMLNASGAMINIGSATQTIATSALEIHQSHGFEYIFSHGGSLASALVLARSNGTQAAPTAMTSGQFIGYLGFSGYDSTTYFDGAYFFVAASENYTATTHGTNIQVNSTRIGQNTPVEVFRFGGGTSARIINISSVDLLTMNGAVLGWTTSVGALANTGFSRLGAASVALGNGTDQDFSGTLKTTIVNAITGYQINGGATSGNVLRGNATNFVSAQLAFSDLSGNISVNQMNSGTGASASTFWRGDGTWSSAGTGTVTSVTFTGDGVVLSSTPSGAVTTSGTVTATLANAAGGTVLSRVAGTTGVPAYTSVPVLGINASTAGTLGLANGGGSGATITLQNLGATGAYNFNLPTTAGTSGQVLTSQAGGSTSMTWSDGVPATSCVWSVLTNAAGNLTLANAGFTTTFNQTSAVAWTWGNTTPTIAPALTLTQVTVSGATTTYTGTITGGGSNAYVGASVTFAGFVTGGNNVTATITASTATTLVVTTTTQANETHAGTAVSSAVTNSPTHVFSTTYEGAANALGTDTWTIGSVIGSLVANPTSTLTFTHAGSTGIGALAVPAGPTSLTTGGWGLTFTGSVVGIGANNSSTFRILASGASPQLQFVFNNTGALLIQGGNGSTTDASVGAQNAQSLWIGDTSNANRTVTTNGGAIVSVGQQANTQWKPIAAGPAYGMSVGGGHSVTGNGFLGFSPASGAVKGIAFAVEPTVNQTSTATGDFTVFQINLTNTAFLGTNLLLADWQLGGTSQFKMTSVGVATTYAATALVGQGIPSQTNTIDLTAQSAAIAATNIIASVPRTGMYRVSMSATITTAGTTSSVLGGTNGFQIVFTSPTDSVAKTTVAGNSVTSAANTTATAIADTITVYCKTGTAIQYSFDYTSVGVTAMSYEIHLRLEAL